MKISTNVAASFSKFRGNPTVTQTTSESNLVVRDLSQRPAQVANRVSYRPRSVKRYVVKRSSSPNVNSEAERKPQSVVSAGITGQSTNTSNSAAMGAGDGFTGELLDVESLAATGAIITPLTSSTKSNATITYFNIPQLDGATDDKPQTTTSTAADLREKIVQKIKAESLARRSPSDKGPVKCYRCKRSYRTVESYEVHIKSCDFIISSDEDEDDDNEMEDDVVGSNFEGNSSQSDDQDVKSYPLRNRAPERTSPVLTLIKSKPVLDTSLEPCVKLRRISDDSSSWAASSQLDESKRRLSAPPECVTDASNRGRRKSFSMRDDRLKKVDDGKSERESEIMYQGTKLLKTPFKRSRGRPKKLRPVLVVPPCPREPPQDPTIDEDMEDTEESTAFDYELGNSATNIASVDTVQRVDEITTGNTSLNLSKSHNIQPKVLLIDSKVGKYPAKDSANGNLTHKSQKSAVSQASDNPENVTRSEAGQNFCSAVNSGSVKDTYSKSVNMQPKVLLIDTRDQMMALLNKSKPSRDEPKQPDNITDDADTKFDSSKSSNLNPSVELERIDSSDFHPLKNTSVDVKNSNTSCEPLVVNQEENLRTLLESKNNDQEVQPSHVTTDFSTKQNDEKSGERNVLEYLAQSNCLTKSSARDDDDVDNTCQSRNDKNVPDELKPSPGTGSVKSGQQHSDSDSEDCVIIHEIKNTPSGESDQHSGEKLKRVLDKDSKKSIECTVMTVCNPVLVKAEGKQSQKSLETKTNLSSTISQSTYSSLASSFPQKLERNSNPTSISSLSHRSESQELTESQANVSVFCTVTTTSTQTMAPPSVASTATSAGGLVSTTSISVLLENPLLATVSSSLSCSASVSTAASRSNTTAVTGTTISSPQVLMDAANTPQSTRKVSSLAFTSVIFECCLAGVVIHF